VRKVKVKFLTKIMKYKANKVYSILEKIK